jgi:hypothetical protein
LHWRPCSTASRRNTTRCQCPSNAAKRFDAGLLNFTDHRQNVCRISVCALFLSHLRVPPGFGELGFPRRLPRALAACKGAEVRALIISRSCRATAAKMWMVSLLACGLSTAMNSTPALLRLLRRSLQDTNASRWIVVHAAVSYVDAIDEGIT